MQFTEQINTLQLTNKIHTLQKHETQNTYVDRQNVNSVYETPYTHHTDNSSFCCSISTVEHPFKMLTLKRQSCHGVGEGRMLKRTTVLLCVNSDGSSKRLTNMLRKSSKLQHFKNIKMLLTKYHSTVRQNSALKWQPIMTAYG